MDARWVIVDVVSLGDAALIAIGLSAGAAVAAQQDRFEDSGRSRPRALLAGGVAGALLALLALAMQALPLRRIFIALSPAMLKSADLRPGGARSAARS